MPSPTPLSNVRLTNWAHAFIGVYAGMGCFAGNVHSWPVGVALMGVGAATGWWVIQELAAVPAIARGLALVVPLGVPLLLAGVQRLPAAAGPRVKRNELNGTWTSQGTSRPFTVRLAGDSAWLSQASGLQNVAYHAAVRQDSLVLKTEGVEEPLRWRIAQDTALHRLVLVAGEGVYLLKAMPK